MVGIIVVAVAVLIILSGFRVAQQYERALVFRFGRFIDTRGPGLFWIVPLGVDRAVKVDLRVFTDGVEQQEAMTRDNVPVKANAVIWYRIVKPDLAIIEVQNVRNAVIQVALTTLRNIIGQHSLDDVLKEREKLAGFIKDRVDQVTEAWGVEIQNVEMKNVEIPTSMQRAMAQEAEALREKRARIIKAEAEYEAALKLREGAEELMKTPASLELRRMQMLTEIGAEQNTMTVVMMPSEFVSAARAFAEVRRGSAEGKLKNKRRGEVGLRVLSPCLGGLVLAVILHMGGAKAVHAVACDRVLPGKELLHRQAVTFAGFIEAEQSALYRGDDFRLTARHPARCLALGQIGKGEGASIGADHTVAAGSIFTSHCFSTPSVFPLGRKLGTRGLFPIASGKRARLISGRIMMRFEHDSNCCPVGRRATEITRTTIFCSSRENGRWIGSRSGPMSFRF